MMNILAPSLLAANPLNFERDVLSAREGGARLLHLDIMDGHFVPNLSYGPHVTGAFRGILPLDVHLMVEYPSKLFRSFLDLRPYNITVHLETENEKKLKALMKEIKAEGVRASVSVKPSTPLEAVIPYLDCADMLLLMTVEPGFGGQAFLDGSLERIERAGEMIGEMDLQIDGGITLGNVTAALKAGANVIVAGSSVFGAEDIVCRTREFVKLLEGG